MAVAPASIADKIEILDDDDEAPRPSNAALPARHGAEAASEPPAANHIAQSPFASTRKQAHVLQVENQRLFREFVEHCSPLTQDCPEVLTYLQTRHAKASPAFLSSVEFRNALGRCLTRAQAKQAKTFVYINELCTVLRQHTAKRRQTISKVEPQEAAAAAGTSLREGEEVKPPAEDEQPSTSRLQGDGGTQEDERKAQRASRKQIAYLENLLKVYNEEICRLQHSELSLDDLGAEDSSYIQEHKLKRKMMKIYDKLCELKGCSTLTGRVIEQRIPYTGTRYPEINRRVERFINSAAVRRDPPDYPDILQQVQLANKRHNLGLSRKQLSQMALEAFRETGSSIQERRHLDLIYNFGSPLTDAYTSTKDPALMDQTLLKKLRSNREVSLTRLEEVITKYAVKQEDAEVQEQERNRRLQKEKEEGKNADGAAESEGAGQQQQQQQEEAAAAEEEEDDDDDDESSDPDIEEEIQASARQVGPDDEDDSGNEAEPAPAAGANGEERPELGAEDGEAAAGALSPLSESSPSLLSNITSPRDSPGQSDGPRLVSYGSVANASNQVSLVLVNSSTDVTLDLDANGAPSPQAAANHGHAPMTNGSSSPAGAHLARGQKRKHEENHIVIQDSESDIPLDMGVFSCDSPPPSKTADSELVSSSQCTPPPKKNKVNVATQCDPDEIIVLSDSD